MEFSDNHHKRRRERLIVPGREDPPRRRVAQAPAPEKSPDVSNTDDDGSFFGIPDTAKDNISTDVSFKDILSAWMRQAIKHSPLENHVKQAGVKKTAASKNLDKMKKDIKWALQADLDEPVLPKPKQKVAKEHKQPAKSPAHAAIHPAQHVATPHQKSVEINISFDSLPKVNFRKLRDKYVATLRRVAKKFSIKQQMMLTGGVVVIVAAVFTVPYLQNHYGLLGGKKQSSEASVKKPQYGTLVPKNLTSSDVNWKRVSPANRDPVFAYADKVNGVSVSVSQQPLPESFKANVDESIEKLAKDFAATDKVTVGSTTFYVGTSHNGPQSVILAKSNLLILIKSTQVISDNIWSEYINSLH